MSEENKSRLEGAIEQLRNHQTQLDADGIMVGVSREALDMALAALSAPKAEAETLPCDVQLPGVQLRKGVSMDTLMFALKRREGRPEEDTRFRTSPVPALTDEAVERVARAWASIDGKLVEFEDERKSGCSLMEEDTGTYEGYMTDAAELLRRSDLLAAFPSKGEGE